MGKIIIALFLALGFFVRIAPVFNHQIYFWFDQGLDMVLAKQLVVDHDVSLVGRYSSAPGVLMGPLWTWLLAIPFLISGGSPVGSVIFFSLLGLFCSLVTYLFLRKYFGLPSAVLVFLVTLIAPVMIYSSRIVASPHPLSFLFIFYIFFLYEIFVRRRTIFWLPLGLLIGIFFQLELGVGVFSLPAVLLVMMIFRDRKAIVAPHLLLGIAVFGLTFVPQIIFDLRHEFLISRSFLIFLFNSKNTLYSQANTIPIRFIERAKSFQEDFFLMALFVRPWHWQVAGIILAILGWVGVIKNKLELQTQLLKILLGILLAFYLGFSLYPGPLWNWYRSGLPIVYILLLFIPLGVLWVRVKVLRIIIIIFMIVILFQGFLKTGTIETLNNKPIVDNAILQNQLLAIDYVYQSAYGKQFSYFAYTPPVYDYIWQYNFWWYGKKKYGYLPRNLQIGVPLLGIGKQGSPPGRNQGLFYTILEPDFERPWQPDGWLKTYIRYGNVLERKEFTGKILVEQRTAQ